MTFENYLLAHLVGIALESKRKDQRSLNYRFTRVSFPQSIVVRYTVEWIGREGLAKETHGEYLQQFCTDFYKGMTKLIDRAMRKEDSSAQGQIITEILQHLHACKNSVTVRNKGVGSGYMSGLNGGPVGTFFFLSAYLYFLKQ